MTSFIKFIAIINLFIFVHSSTTLAKDDKSNSEEKISKNKTSYEKNVTKQIEKLQFFQAYQIIKKYKRKKLTCKSFNKRHKNKTGEEKSETIKESIYELVQDTYTVQKSIAAMEKSLTNNKKRRIIELLKKAKKLKDRLLKSRRTIQLCEFQRQIKIEIKTAINDPNSKMLKKLLHTSECFKDTNPKNLVLSNSIGKSFFTNTFKHFQSKKELTEEDCNTLRRTYQIWSSFYEQQNISVSKSKIDYKIPVYNVNPHNSSFHYWLKESLNQGFPKEGLTLLHADTHTDMSHIHDHQYIEDPEGPLEENKTRHLKLRFRSLKKLIRYAKRNIISSDRRKEKTQKQFNEVLKKELDKSTEFKNEKEKETTFKYLTEKPPLEAIEILYNQSRKTVHQISQPIIGAVASDVTSKVVLCLPPWQKRLPRNKINPKTKKADHTPSFLCNKNDTLKPSTYRKYEKELDSYIFDFYDESEIAECEKKQPKKPYRCCKVKDFTFSVTECNNEVTTEYKTEDDKTYYIPNENKNKLPDFFSYFGEKEKKNGYILDIDLDAFVSEGTEDDAVMPISFARTEKHQKSYGSHNGHEQSNENDPIVEVSSLEIDRVKERVDNFFNRIRKAKDDGYIPKVITIADSTVLMRALTGDSDDSLSGGNYTPSCFVFLLNYLVKQKLKETFPEAYFGKEKSNT